MAMSVEDFCDTSATPGRHYRFRFLTFNLANSQQLQSSDAIQGLFGQPLERSLASPLSDGSDPDAIFVSFPESCLDIASLSEQLGTIFPRCRLQAQSAAAESKQTKSTKVRALIEEVAARHSGDMQTLLIHDDARFQEDAATIFGLLTDVTVAGVRVPNPKKSFVGQGVAESGGARFGFIGAHFPITQLAALLDSEDLRTRAAKAEGSTLQAAKRLLAAGLRSVLRTAASTMSVDGNTVLFLQGDLNSRTLLEGSRCKDVLLEVFKDRPLQRAIQRGLELPSGRWHEVGAGSSESLRAAALPVTYKFQPNPAEASALDEALRIGDVLEEASKARLFPNAPSGEQGVHVPEKYRETMVDAEEACSRWGLAFKKSAFRPFRFPACPDRMIYWAADSLNERMSWELPQGGYQVNFEQLGSDHKPVWLDLSLHIAPPLERAASPEKEREGEVEDLDDFDSLPGEGAGTSQPSTAPPLHPTSVGSVMSWWARCRPNLRPGRDWNWTPDRDAADCEICDVPFSLLRRRHHCRHCGRCVCDGCSPVDGWRCIPEVDPARPSRLCLDCAPAERSSASAYPSGGTRV
ncbi:slob1 [Symbiodinium natans]|uniref:Slob1 protein n=1 Tax=Symbiodinium natans TaxID=878477 RepID=A0A812LH56_9DINO|nr:slob1 [Symbiodinium natans]